MVEPPRTHSKLPYSGPMECRHNYSGLRRLGVVEPPRTHSKLPYSGPMECRHNYSGLRRLGVVEPPRTHSKLPYSGPLTTFRLTYTQQGNSCVISDTNCLPSTEVE